MVKRALLIGINYNGTAEQLRGCINDVNNINNILVSNCGYKSEDIRILTDESQIKPTRQNIESNIRWLVSNLMKGDTLVFYFSGHGSQLTDRTSDESDKKDEVIIPLDYQTAGVITDDWLFQNMCRVIPQDVTLWGFMDCCHSGTSLDLKFNYNSLCAYKKGNIVKGMPYVPNDWTDRFSFAVERSQDIPGVVCVFSGSNDNQTSADASIQNQFQGAFSHCFIEFLKTNMITENGRRRYRNGAVKLRNILKEINCRLDIAGFSQNSQLSLSKQTDLERTLDL